MAVNDEARPQTVIGQLFPDVIRMAINLCVRSITKMSRKPRSGERCSGVLRRSRRGVADGDDAACGGSPFNENNPTGLSGREAEMGKLIRRTLRPILNIVPNLSPRQV